MKNILKNDCPSCGKTRVFPPFSYWWIPLRFPKMTSKCSSCGYKYDKEPGYFFGAAYVTYAFGTAETLLSLFIASAFIDNPWVIVGIAIGVVTLLAPFNYKYSRLIWMNLLYKV